MQELPEVNKMKIFFLKVIDIFNGINGNEDSDTD